MRIEYVQSSRWRIVWGVAVLAIISLAGAAGWHWLQRSGQAGDLNTRIAAIKAQIQRALTPAAVVVDPRQLSTELATGFLRTDYNKVFAVVENLNEPGARLRALTLEMSSNTLRLEYDLDTVVKASTVTTALNAGYEDRPWKLESVSGSSSPVTSGFVPIAPTFRGVWSAQVDKL